MLQPVPEAGSALASPLSYKAKTSFPRSFFGRKEVCLCGGQQLLAETGGVGGVGPCCAPCFTLENRPAPRSTAPDSPLRAGFSLVRGGARKARPPPPPPHDSHLSPG